MASPVVFILRDTALEDLMDQVAEKLAGHGLEIVRGPNNAHDRQLDYSNVLSLDLLSRVSVMVLSNRVLCTRDTIELARRLKGIVNPTIGVENIDLRAADENGVIIGHGATPEVYVSIAEANILLMLMLLYSPGRTQQVLKGTQERPRPTSASMWARMLAGKTIGLVGFGRIGRAIAER